MRMSQRGYPGCCHSSYHLLHSHPAPVAYKRCLKLPRKRSRCKHPAVWADSGTPAAAHPATRPQQEPDSSPRQARVKHTTWLNKGAADALGSPFHELGLQGAPLAQVPIKRRNYTLLTSKSSNQQEQQHAASENQQQEQQQHGSWADAYADPRLPLAVDVGCGAGRFLLLLATKDADCKCNYLGLDIQPALVERANAWAAHLGLSGRVQYLQADAAAQLQRLLDSYPGRLELVTVQFPDPQHHRDRCAMQPALVHVLRQVLPPDGQVLLQTEDEATALYMRQLFWDDGHGMFQPAEEHYTQQLAAAPHAEPPKCADDEPHVQHGIAADRHISPMEGRQAAELHSGTAGSMDMPWADAGWLGSNPLGVPTERELFVESVRAKAPWKERVYRLLLIKQHVNVH